MKSIFNCVLFQLQCFSYKIVHVKFVSVIETWTLIWGFHKKVSSLQKWNSVHKNKKKEAWETSILSSSEQIWITFISFAIPISCIRFRVTSMMNHTSLLSLLHCGFFVQTFRFFCSIHCGSSQASWQCCVHVTIRHAEGASLDLNIQPNHTRK